MRDTIKEVAKAGIIFGMALWGLFSMVMDQMDVPVTDNQDGWCDQLRCEDPAEYTWGEQELCSWHRKD